jgi:hypothetical protein
LKAEDARFIEHNLNHRLTNEDANGARIVIESPPPPEHLSLIIGDFLTNARAALDYIAWELAVRHFDPLFDPEARSDKMAASFPIVDIPSKHSKHMTELGRRKIPAAAIKAIESVQPYNAGYEPLLWLNRLVNGDKHHVLTLTVVSIKTAQLRIDLSEALRDDKSSIEFPLMLGSTQANRNEIVIPDASKLPVKVDGQFRVYIAFQDSSMPDGPAGNTLASIGNCVRSIIPMFEGFF